VEYLFIKGVKKIMDKKLLEFKKICEELSVLYVEKNNEYGDSFGKIFEEDGLAPCLYQIKHKLNRALTLAETEKLPKFETLEDTLRDMANYSIMTLLEYRMTLKETYPKGNKSEERPPVNKEKTCANGAKKNKDKKDDVFRKEFYHMIFNEPLSDYTVSTNTSLTKLIEELLK